MWNILLDFLPEEWNGYPIDGDFRTGIQITQCLHDESLTGNERFFTALELLFPDKKNRPEYEEGAKGLAWYLSDYNHDNHDKDSGKDEANPVMDFYIDQFRIYAAFLNQYRVDLSIADMHWFTFMGLLSNLDECAFTRVVDIRTKKIDPKLSQEEKKALKRAKQIFAIKAAKEDGALSPEEKKKVDEFMKYAKMNKE